MENVVESKILDQIYSHIYAVESSLFSNLQSNTLDSDKSIEIKKFLRELRDTEHALASYSSVLSNEIFNALNDALNSADAIIGGIGTDLVHFDLTKITNLRASLKTQNMVIDQSIKSYENLRPNELERKFTEVISEFAIESAQLLQKKEDIQITLNEAKNLSSNISKLSDNELKNLQNRTNQFTDKLQADFNELTESLKDNAKINVELQESEAKVNVEKLQKFAEEGEKQAHLLSGWVLSDFFSLRAVEEKKTAENWTKYTWWFASAAIVALIIIFIYQIRYFVQGQEIDYGLLSTKILITATLGLTAKWTSKRASRHLQEESKYHRLAINMQTINSFIAQLKEENKEEIMKTVALKIFTETGGNEIATDYESANIFDGLKSIIPKTDK